MPHIRPDTPLTPGAITSAYVESYRKKWALIGGLVIVTFAVAVFAVVQGSFDLPVREVVKALIGRAQGASAVVITNIRLPRVIAALVCGWGLALSGLGIQSLLRNPLASPSTLGISQGAAFGASAAVVLFGGGLMAMTGAAFLGAMGATLIILILAHLKRLSVEAIILAGVALAALFSSATILIQYLANEIQLSIVVFWTFGDVARSNWPQIKLLTGITFLASLYLTFLRWDLNALSSSEETARGLGVNVERIRRLGMLAVALIAALATAFHGVIAFVGLIAPHMARRLIGDDHRLLIPLTSVLGALLLLTADTLGRIVIGSGALPVGVITSFLGAPMFLYLLIRGYR